MRPLKLSASALIVNALLSDSQAPATEGREDGEESVHTPKTPSNYASQESNKTELCEMEILQLALEYLEKRVDAAAADREARYEMCSESPKGSQNSFVVSYSQDSKLSGDEPPKIKVVAEIIMVNLSEERLQQLFEFNNLDDLDRRVDIAISFLDTDLKIFCELVKETMVALSAM